MNRLLIATVAVLAAVAGAAMVRPGSAAMAGPLLRALNLDSGKRTRVVATLTADYVRSPESGSTARDLGLAHLWSASDAPPEQALPHLVLAEHYLARAKAMLPDDDRIPGWLIPATIARSKLEHDDAGVAGGVKSMREAAAAATPEQRVFHSVPLAIVAFGASADSPEFVEALALMRKVGEAGPDQRAAGNAQGWPHNVEGFMLGLADMELKAGNRQRASVMLQAITQRPGFERWRYKDEVETRLATLAERGKRYADADPANDPPLAFGYGGVGCVLCHGADGGK